MPRVALILSDIETLNGRVGDAATFVIQFARLLRENGEDVSVILAHGGPKPVTVDESWCEALQSLRIELIELNNRAALNRAPDVWLMRLSEQVAPILPAFDVVYFSDRANVAFHTVRSKRFTASVMPVCVTVLHGPSQWARLWDEAYPRIPEDLNLDFVERYGALHSDFIAAPSQAILDWVKSDGWQFRGETGVLGLPYTQASLRKSDGRAAVGLKRLVVFSPIETRAGLALMVSALRQLFEEAPRVPWELDELVLSGYERESAGIQWVRQQLKRTGLRIEHVTRLNGFGASEYLASNARSTLAVIPSPTGASLYAAIEASSIPDLNWICARAGGISEILDGLSEAQLFDPSPYALAAKLRERLKTPLSAREMVRYDCDAANRRWLAFHARVCDGKRASPRRVDVAGETLRPAVDVCVTYYNQTRYFPQLLESLNRQTIQKFGVIAVDDGSPDEGARAGFDSAAERYGSRGWVFLRQPNLFADAARNRAATHSTAEYLLMLDADDVLAPNAVERMLQAARLSGDDCLVSASCLFTGDDFPFDLDSGELIAPVSGLSMPLGANLVAALLDPAVLGGPMILIRREVFEAIGGYRELRGAARGDRELLARLALKGYKTDVVSEYVHFYRQVENGLSRTCDPFLAKLRMVETYDHCLAEEGLPGAASALCGLYGSREAEALPRKIAPPKENPEEQFLTRSVRSSVSGLGRFAADDEGHGLVRMMRRAYRQVLPLHFRLRLHMRMLKLMRKERQL